MNYTLTAEQDMIVRSLRAFREQELEPHEAEVDRAGEVAEELGQRIKSRALEMGFYAPNLPEEIGGGGLDYTTMAVVEREYGKTSHALHSWIARPTEILLACEGEQLGERYNWKPDWNVVARQGGGSPQNSRHQGQVVSRL